MTNSTIASTRGNAVAASEKTEHGAVDAAPRVARILFVDDDAIYRDGAVRGVGTGDFTIATASSGPEALELLAAEPFDIICTDEHMPGMRGSQLLAEVKARYPHVSRIILSGFAELDVVLHVVNEIGVFRFLTKPCHPADLRAVFEQAMRARSERAEMLEPLRAIEETQNAELARFQTGLDRLWLAAQPIVSTRSWQTFGYEVLLRSDEGSVAAPHHFFGLAATLGETRRLERAIRSAAARLADRLPDGVALFLNIECETLMDDSLFDPGSPVSRHASKIVLEITERSRLDGVADVPARIRRLRDLGYRIAVDDLGAGYAGLNSIAEIGPDIVKFDYSLVHEVQESPVRRRLLRTMLELCHELGILAVAEGVETRDELVEMVALGCPLLQGYLFAKPGRPFPKPVLPGGSF